MTNRARFELACRAAALRAFDRGLRIGAAGRAVLFVDRDAATRDVAEIMGQALSDCGWEPKETEEPDAG